MGLKDNEIDYCRLFVAVNR